MRLSEAGPIVQQVAVKSLPLRSRAIVDARWLDRLALGVLLLTAAVAAATFRDYGLGWDDYTHSQYGNLLVSLYRSGFADRRALSFVNLYMYGGGFDILATLAAKILPFGLFETRRLVGALVGLVGLFVTWRLGRRLGGPFAGLVSLVLLAACPLYYGHMFINAKDGPFAAVMMIALLGLVRAFEEYPRATPTTLALCGVGIGLSIGARVLGGFAVLEALLPLPLIFAIRARADRAENRPPRNAGHFSFRSFRRRSWPIWSWVWSGRGAWFRRSIRFTPPSIFPTCLKNPGASCSTGN